MSADNKLKWEAIIWPVDGPRPCSGKGRCLAIPESEAIYLSTCERLLKAIVLDKDYTARAEALEMFKK
jgi:hypothetical protein